jgi:hypothetical protein
MSSSPRVLFQAWTEQFDRWFAASGSLLMRGELNAVFFEAQFERTGIRTTARFLRLDATRLWN